MKKIIKYIENKQIKKYITFFRSGDIIELKIFIKEGKKKRIQKFKGLVIAKKNKGINSSFKIIKKYKNKEIVERIFKLHSPNIKEIKLIKKGKTKKSKLYYFK